MPTPTAETPILADEVRLFLEETGMAPTTFGRAAIGDTAFVARLYAGRAPNERTILRVRGYMDAHRAGRGGEPAPALAEAS